MFTIDKEDWKILYSVNITFLRYRFNTFQECQSLYVLYCLLKWIWSNRYFLIYRQMLFFVSPCTKIGFNRYCNKHWFCGASPHIFPLQYVSVCVCLSVCISVINSSRTDALILTFFVKWLLTLLVQIFLKLVTLSQRSRSHYTVTILPHKPTYRLVSVIIFESLLHNTVHFWMPKFHWNW